jgi:hypothetical protein
MSKLRRFPRVSPGDFRNNLGDNLMEISLAQKNFVLYRHGQRMCVFTPIERGARGEIITPSEYRRHSSEYIAKVRYGHKRRFIIAKRGRKLAWMRPVEDVGIAPGR